MRPTSITMLIAIILMTVSLPGMAAQIRIADDDAEIVAVISAREVSRIALEGDRIITLAAVPRGYSIDHDAETGDLYLVPQAFIPAGSVVNMFITSEAGRTYQLLLETRDIPSEQIIIRRPGGSGEVMSSSRKSVAPRREALAHLIRGVITGALLDDYRRAAVAKTVLPGGGPGLVPVEVWKGETFTAWRVHILGGTDDRPWGDLFPEAAAVWLADDGQTGVIVIETGDGS